MPSAVPGTGDAELKSHCPSRTEQADQGKEGGREKEGTGV